MPKKQKRTDRVIEDRHQQYNHQIRVTAICIENESLLLVKQKMEDREWSLPGGRLEKNETIDQALKREVFEETGLTVEINKFLYMCDKPENSLIHLTFFVNKTNGKIQKPTNEYDSNPIYDVKFVPIRELIQYGFKKEFVDRIEANFPDAGSYMGLKMNIGL